jgi:hypothetical protein
VDASPASGGPASGRSREAMRVSSSSKMLRRMGAGRFAISETVFSRVRGFFFGRRPDARRCKWGAMRFAAPPFGDKMNFCSIIGGQAKLSR